jgi:hypothetical protein
MKVSNMDTGPAAYNALLEVTNSPLAIAEPTRSY